MAISNYTKRAQDSLDISAVADALVVLAKGECKKAIAHSVEQKVSAFKQFKSELEAKLVLLSTSAVGGWFAKLKNRSALRKIKEQLSAINRQMVEWVNRTYRYFFVAA